MSSSLYILLATQRCGTNMLRSILETHPAIAALPEVFHDDHYPYTKLPGFVYYEEFFLQRVREDPEMALPKNRKENVRTYLKWLAKCAAEANITPLIDVKYNSLHHAEGTWSNPNKPPVMLQILHNRSFPVIHLHRKNSLSMVISLLRAEITQQYVASTSEEVHKASITINPQRLLHELKFHHLTEDAVDKHLKSMGIQCLDINYEDLFTNGPGSDFSREKFNEIADFMGVDGSLIELKPATERLASRGYREEIENFDELEKALRDTPYHETFMDHA